MIMPHDPAGAPAPAPDPSAVVQQVRTYGMTFVFNSTDAEARDLLDQLAAVIPGVLLDLSVANLGPEKAGSIFFNQFDDVVPGAVDVALMRKDPEWKKLLE